MFPSPKPRPSRQQHCPLQGIRHHPAPAKVRSKSGQSQVKTGQSQVKVRSKSGRSQVEKPVKTQQKQQKQQKSTANPSKHVVSQQIATHELMN